MSISQLQLFFDSFLYIDGNSESDPTRTWQMWRPLTNAIAEKYSKPSGVAGALQFTKTRIANFAVVGSRIADVASRLSTNLPLQAYDKFIFFIGTNEPTQARAQTQAALVSLFATLTPTGKQALFVGPYAKGEEYPTGQNGAGDARLDETVIDIANACAGYANCKFVDLRTVAGALYSTVMPPVNLPPPGATDGIFTDPDGVGLHFNPRGRAQAYKLWGPSVALL